MIQTVLVDRRNFDALKAEITSAVQSATWLGLDAETEDSARHDGLNLLLRYDEDGFKAKNTKTIFDLRRMTMCGFSIYPEGAEKAWYFNLAHADVENRLRWDEVKPILDARPANGFWLCHNASFEIAVFQTCHAYELTNVVCTMQLSVTAFGDDNYDLDDFRMASLGGMGKLVTPLMMEALKGGPPADDERFNRGVEELIGKITSKTSDAAHSYNGWVDEIAYGHGLKQLVQRFFGHTMTTFEQVMNGKPHMGKLTGEEVASYGAEDAYWVVPLFHKLMIHVATHSPDALETFFDQENPMVYVFADLWRAGMRVNVEAIRERQGLERQEFAKILRQLKAALKELPPFAAEPNAELVKREKWYKNYERYRTKWLNWIAMADSDDDFEQCRQVSSPVGNAWAAERGDFAKPDLSITHYMPVRTLLYDWMGCKLQFDMGSIISNGEARGKILNVEKDETKRRVVELLGQMAGVEQRIKLYLTPYLYMVDPETGRLYPQLNCLLNTRRLACSTPNAQQLAKRGESTYVRGFFQGDNDEHLIVSLDWSSIELVIIGELSGDPEFKKAFGQRPYEDMHAGAATAILNVEMPWLTEDQFRDLKRLGAPGDFYDKYGVSEKDASRLFTNLKGEPIADCKKAYSLWRTELGKGANFNFWYSSFLFTIGQKMGWGLETTGNATELYKQRFAIAEDWRIGVISHAQEMGWVQLPDGHRRFRYEATHRWMDEFKAKWPRDQILDPIAHEIARRVNRRAGNQAVNAVVQGTCATIMKRSIQKMQSVIKEKGWADHARFMMAIHDELLYSVHHSIAVEFIDTLKGVMLNHPEIFQSLVLDASPAIGRTFEPWSAKKAPFGQIELSEPPAELVGEALAGKPLDAIGMQSVVDYLIGEQRRLAA